MSDHDGTIGGMDRLIAELRRDLAAERKRADEAAADAAKLRVQLVACSAAVLGYADPIPNNYGDSASLDDCRRTYRDLAAERKRADEATAEGAVLREALVDARGCMGGDAPSSGWDCPEDVWDICTDALATPGPGRALIDERDALKARVAKLEEDIRAVAAQVPASSMHVLAPGALREALSEWARAVLDEKAVPDAG